MKIWAVVGVHTWGEDNWIYALCTSEEIARRELLEAMEEDDGQEWRWEIEELNVIDK